MHRHVGRAGGSAGAAGPVCSVRAAGPGTFDEGGVMGQGRPWPASYARAFKLGEGWRSGTSGKAVKLGDGRPGPTRSSRAHVRRGGRGGLGRQVRREPTNRARSSRAVKLGEGCRLSHVRPRAGPPRRTCPPSTAQRLCGPAPSAAGVGWAGWVGPQPLSVVEGYRHGGAPFDRPRKGQQAARHKRYGPANGQVRGPPNSCVGPPAGP